MFRSYDHFQGEIYTSEISVNDLALIILNLAVCILLCVIDQVQRFPSNATVSIVVYYFVQNIRYMFRSYDHLQLLKQLR
jgi:hypothetical protein